MTAEFALALPALVVLLAVVLAAGRVVLAQVGCVDAARAAARAAARGEDPAVVRAAAAALAPRGAAVVVRAGAGTVVVEVSSRQSLAGPWGGDVLARGTATAAVEAAGVQAAGVQAAGVQAVRDVAGERAGEAS
ncbi:TadE family type IV pilus minor pilin [Kineococcus sp. SYSU DK006]|uniref:TadE family type IV pilus minor pilin n=1 Tax=Kineococcus sp. SYSU DK006 TaxID=3383127 RepID=UPI003D7C48B4